MSSRPAHLRGAPVPGDAKRRGPLLSPLHKAEAPEHVASAPNLNHPMHMMHGGGNKIITPRPQAQQQQQQHQAHNEKPAEPASDPHAEERKLFEAMKHNPSNPALAFKRPPLPSGFHPVPLPQAASAAAVPNSNASPFNIVPSLPGARPGPPPPSLFQAGYRPTAPAAPQNSLQSLRQKLAALDDKSTDKHVTPRDGGASKSYVNDDNMLTMMTKRLSALEKLVSVQSVDIRQRDMVVAQLTEKLQRLESIGIDDSLVVQSESLRRENHKLKRQLHEMETFLQDYGLIWIGYRDDEEAQISEAQPLSDSIYFDMQQMTVALKDLNISLTEAAKMNVINDHGVHRFKREEFPSESLIFYKNGIYFKNGPLRPYSLPDTHTFCDDILDGYFPFELKEQYPNGVVFNFQDKSTECCPSPFARLDKLAGHSLQDNVETESTSQVLSENPPQMSAEQLLQRLPDKIIRGGQVMAIRSDIASMLGKDKEKEKDGMVLVQTEALRRLQDDPSMATSLTTLRVKLTGPHGSQGTLLLKLHFDDLVSTLRAHIAEHCAPTVEAFGDAAAPSAVKVELRTTFPNRLYDDDTQTLRAAGLTPNALLLAKIL